MNGICLGWEKVPCLERCQGCGLEGFYSVYIVGCGADKVAVQVVLWSGCNSS